MNSFARRFCTWLFAVVFMLGFAGPRARGAQEAGTIRVLLLGDTAGHKPTNFFKAIDPALRKKNIEIEYTQDLNDLNAAKLSGFDCLMIFANWTKIEPQQETALLDFVAAGGGFVPVHCASFCFLNSPKYIELVGGQFKSHQTGVFKETYVKPEHPILQGLSPIESWDETYVHSKHNTNRVVLSERRDEKGNEPYTWVREHGKGRVFYTAWGHDQRTWTNVGFLALLENGVRWASENSPTHLKPRAGLKPFEYTAAAADLPNYRAGAQWGTQDEPIRTMQKPLAPEESMPHLVTFPQFDVSLFASEPDVVKAIWMAWDERGRLWVASTVDYPNNMQPEGEGHDRLIICEDTNGDGKADKFTTFADKLSVPTSFCFANGGVLVVHSGKVEFLKDTNGDDKADERRDVIKGFGTQDTHAGPSNLHYGFDNWIWGTVGYSGFNGTVGGKQLRFGQGIFRFKPDGSALEFIRSSNNNTWGLAFTEDNIVIGSTANGNASMYMPIANRYYEAVNGFSAGVLGTIADSQRFYPITEKVRQVDYHGKFTAGAGSAIYTARSFPKEFWNTAQFVAEPTGHLLARFNLERKGADFVALNERSFAASDDEWTSPVCAEVGPDGALWVSDWYNYVIQHNPTPRGFRTGKGNAYETPLRDTAHGRIYRIAYKQAGKPSLLRLNKNDATELVAALKSDNLFWRMTAQRLLVERGNKDVVGALTQLAKEASVDELGLNAGAIHALWTLQGLGVTDGAAAKGDLKHKSAGVRRAAVMTLPRNEDSLKAILMAETLKDSDAQVRMAALLACSEMPSSDDAAKAVFAILQEPANSNDRWIPDAATAAAAKNDAKFLKAVLASYKPETKQASAADTKNLAPNASFEDVRDNKPSGWRAVTHNGRGELTVADVGHGGSHSAKISSEQGGDISWSTQIPVKPRTDYQLSAWIKTENVQRVGGGRGALLNIHELQDPAHGATKAISGNSDWTRVEMTFNSAQMTEVTVNCLFGGWGRATGTAYFDDVELIPAPASSLPGEVGRVVRVVTTHYAQRGATDTIVETLEALKGASPELAAPILDGLVAGWPENKAPSLSPDDKKKLAAVMEAAPESVRDRLLALSQRWNQPDLFGANVAAIVDSLRKLISDAAAPDEKRVAAAKRLAGIDSSSEVIEFVLKQISVLSPPDLANGFINALSESRSSATGKAILEAWKQYTPGARRNAVAALMRKPAWANELLSAVESGKVSRGDIAADQWSQLKTNPDRRVAGRAGRLMETGNAVSADREEIVKKLLPLAKEKGDTARGKEVFTATCAVCHTFNGVGGKVGPDLSGIGARDRGEILTDILDPNRSVEANFRLWNVTTKGGDTYSGRLETETQTTVEILDTTAQKHVIARKDIEKMEGLQTSIMPAGFEALPPDDIKGLLEYICTTHP
jgi:putative membrane-bound dehydrogenase-like protein